MTKQAVLLIHGIGEQRPMDTLRGFVDAVWRTNTSLHNPHNEFSRDTVWSKPDTVSASYELRRLTTPENRSGIRTDFFEFYWAHLMEGTSYGHVLAWVKTIVWRSPRRVPGHLRLAYLVLWILLLTALFFAAYAAVNAKDEQSAIPAWASAVITLLLLPLVGLAVKSFIGDAARYLHVAPTNVQRRHEIRHAGVELLKQLHAPEREYDRIIVVGHSLGSVIGYDILTLAWTAYNEARVVDSNEQDVDKPPVAALNALEEIARSTSTLPADTIQQAQRDYFVEMKRNGNKWRVSDFITLGSPLAHSAILLAKDGDELQRKIDDREYPSCLPALETSRKKDGTEIRRFSYDGKRGHRIPHHAAVFAPTRWSNLYFPCRGILYGDLIGGPIAGVLGGAIADHPVSTGLKHGLLSHTLYWSLENGKPSGSVRKLRQVLDLEDRTKVI